MNGNQIKSFKEKPQTRQGWINGGYFVIEPEFFDLISGDDSILEREPLESVAEMGQLMAFQHDAFWQCMDTKRDRDHLEELWSLDGGPWKV
jgi:glucose-1-phosphate cytidylyltransferase